MKTVITSALIGSIAALAGCLIFFNFFYKPAHSDNLPSNNTASPAPTMPITRVEIPNPEINADDVRSVSIQTVYKGYFEAGSKCAKTYNEYFGNEDGIGSSSSPCTVNITFTRDGKAARSIEISRWDKTAKEKRIIEKTDSAAEITAAQFNDIAQTIVTNTAFRDWREGTMINVSNCTITVEYSGGTRSPMSNVAETTTAYLPMVESFRQLEKQLSWK